MIGNLRENFLYARLPGAVLSSDERGLVCAVIGGFQDRLSDLRSYTNKIGAFWTPTLLGASSDAPNAVLVTIAGNYGKSYTRGLDFDSTTPADGTSALTAWAASQLGLPLSAVSNVRYGRDLLRTVDEDLLSKLAATLGAVIYRSTLLATTIQQKNAATQLVDTWFPRLKIKGTAQSFEVLGRMLGFDDVRVQPLWSTLEPHNPDDVGSPENDADFATVPEYYPGQKTPAFYSPYTYRDGDYAQWSVVIDNGTSASNFYPLSVNGHNPWVRVDVVGPISNGTVTHPASGSIALSGGLPNFRAYAEPAGSGVRFKAVADGEGFNGLVLNFRTSGSQCVVSILDRLSAIKYRSSYFDIGLTADMDKLEELFGSRAATTNKDLENNPITSDGTATSPYTPYTGGSYYAEVEVSDWISTAGSYGSPYPFPQNRRRQADPTVRRQLNLDEATVAGVQVIQAMDEVRAATRFPRRSQVGVLIDDKAAYSAFVDTTLLFTATTGTTSYSGTVATVPACSASARLENVPYLLSTWNATVGAYYILRGIYDPPPPGYPAYVDFPIGYADRVDMSYTLPGGWGDFTGFSLIRIPNTASADNWVLTDIHDSATVTAESDPANPAIGYYRSSTLATSGTFNASTGQFSWTIPNGNWPGAQVYVDWHPTTTELIRTEPTFQAKYSGTTAYQARPEDDQDVTLEDTADDVAWRRSIVLGGELVDADIYVTGDEVGVDPVSDATAFTDQNGVDISVYALPSQHSPRRITTEYRPTDGSYMPSMYAVGYQGTFKDLGDYTAYDTSLPKPPDPGLGSSLGDTRTDYDTLFEPGYKLFHVGSCHGVLVADLNRFNGTHHRSGLVCWLPFNEHPDDVLDVLDRSTVNSDSHLFGLLPSDRIFDETFGWVLKLSTGYIEKPSYKSISKNQTLSLWLNLSVLPSAETTVAECAGLRITLDSSGVVAGYAQRADSSWQKIGYTAALSLGTWFFVYAAKTLSDAKFGYGTLASLTGSTSTAGLFSPADQDQPLKVQAGDAKIQLHDLRVWNLYKTDSDLALVRNYSPVPTLCTYPLGRVESVDKSDHYGLRVLSSGWVTLDRLPPSYRHSAQALVRRYGSLGDYHGQSRYKETGLGGGYRFSGSAVLGRQFLDLTGYGSYAYSGSDGYMPGWSAYWGSVTGQQVAWMEQTNVFRESIWVDNEHTATSSSSIVVQKGTVSFTANEAGMYYLVGGRVRLADTGSSKWIEGTIISWDSQATFNLAVDGTNGSGLSSSWNIIDQNLYELKLNGNAATTWLEPKISNQDSGAFTLPFSMDLLAGSGTSAGTGAMTSLYMYLNSREVSSTSTTAVWTDAWSVTPNDNAVDPIDKPSIVTQTGSTAYLNTPVIGEDGTLEFLNTVTLQAGHYELTVDSGNIGLLDSDFDGFSVNITVGPYVFARKLLPGTSGYNVRGKDTFVLDIPETLVNRWLLGFELLNALKDTSRGTMRQLAVYGYSLRRIYTEPYKVQIGAIGNTSKPVLTLLDATNVSTPGGWIGIVNSYGSHASQQQECRIYSDSDTLENPSPASNILTGLTGERRDDIVYAGTQVVLADDAPYVMPTYGAITCSPNSGTYQVGDLVTFSVSGTGNTSGVYSYVWKFWDGTGTATPGPQTSKQVNMGSNPSGAGPSGLRFSCTAVATDGQSAQVAGVILANNPPTLLPGAGVTRNDTVFSYSTRLSLSAFDFENDPIEFAWYSGTTFLSSGTSVSSGTVNGTWQGNGVTRILSRNLTQNHLDMVVSSPRNVTCYVRDNHSGTTAMSFDLRGRIPVRPSATASAGFDGITADATSLPEQRIGQGQSVTFTVYAKDPGRNLSFGWAFYGSNNWSSGSVNPTNSVTTPTADGGYQNVLIRPIDMETLLPGTRSKQSTAVCYVVATDTLSGHQDVTQVDVPVTLVADDSPSFFQVTRKVNGAAIIGTGPVTRGDVIEFSTSGTDPNGDVVTAMWRFAQPFSPSVGLFWGPKFLLPTSGYSSGQAVQGTLTLTDRLGQSTTEVIPVTLVA